MTTYAQLISTITKEKIIPVIVIDTIEDAVLLADILVNNHVNIIEITFRTDIAEKALTAIKQKYPHLIVGAGTILNAEDAHRAKQCGADFIVSPGTNLQTIHASQSLNIPIIPGVNNPTAIEMALNEGLTLLKFFPAEASGGIAMIKALLAPYQNITLIPTGGITLENIQSYLGTDRVIGCGLSWIVDKKLIQNKDWDSIEKRAKEIQLEIKLGK